MPVIKHTDKGKSKSVGSSLDKVPSEGGSKKFNFKFEKVTKTDPSRNTTSKKLKCVTSNFKCLFYKRKARESDGRSESSKSSSPTGDSVHSSSPTSTDEFLTPDLEPNSVNEIPVPLQRRSRTSSGTSGGTLDRPIPAPRTIRPSIVPICSRERIPSQQVIYDEQSSLRNFHLQSLGHIGPQGQLLFRAPTQNFRHPPPPASVALNGPPLPPRNNSNFPSVVYAPGRSHGPMVAYVRGPFPPSRHPQNMSMVGRPPHHFPPPPHIIRVRAQHQQGQQAFILRYPPPPRLLFRSPYEHPNYPPNYRGNHDHEHDPSQDKYYHSAGRIHEDEMHAIKFPSIPPRKQSLSAHAYLSHPNLNELHDSKLGGHFQTLKLPSENIQNSSKKLNAKDKESHAENNKRNSALIKKNDKLNHYGSSANVVSAMRRNEISLVPGGSDPTIHQTAASLWPTVLIDHKLPRVPNPMQDNHQRQVVTQSMRQLGNRNASLINISTSTSSGNSSLKSNNTTKMYNQHGSSSCTDLRRIQDKNSNDKSCVPWFRWFARYLLY